MFWDSLGFISRLHLEFEGSFGLQFIRVSLVINFEASLGVCLRLHLRVYGV